MRHATFFVLMFSMYCITQAFAADDKAAATKKEFENLQGIWKFVSIETTAGKFEAKEAPAGTDLSSFNLTIKGMTLTFGKDEGTLTIDPTTKPKLIDIEYAKDKFLLETIYEVDGDTLRICFRRGRGEAKDRPSSFSVKDFPNYEIRVYQRQKP
jgi:uncharacterized protein (TIGR03067 family)